MNGENLRNNNYYKDPQILENENGNTKIIFESNRDNLIQFATNEATLTVKVPQSVYYYSSNGTPVFATDAQTYSFNINNKTVDSINAEIISTNNYGSISISGEHEFYLDDEVTITFEPLQQYTITGWTIVSNYGDPTPSPIDESILITEYLDNYKTLKFKVLSGFEQKITIVPNIETARTINATFKNGIKPSESKTLYSFDTLTLSYTDDNYYLENWKIWDKDNERYLTTEEIYSFFDQNTFNLSNKDEQ